MPETLRLGSLGIHALVVALGDDAYGISADALKKGLFDATVERAVKTFQTCHVDPGGRPLKEDGIVGPLTWWALEHPGRSASRRFIQGGWMCRPSSEREEVRPVLVSAMGEIGTYETPPRSNLGEIEKYGGHGLPWCGFFVSWCYARRPEGSPFGVMASAYKFHEWGRVNNRLLTASDNMMAGDIFIILRETFRGHVGIIAHTHHLDEPLLVSTIEGNINDAVRGMRRHRQIFTDIVRPCPCV